MVGEMKPFCVIRDLNFTGEITLGQWDGEQFYVMTDGDCYTPAGLVNYDHKLCTLAELECVMSSDYSSLQASRVPDAIMPVNEFVVRKGDMGPNGRLRLIKQPDGDICVAVIPDEGEIGIEFCTIGTGGGKSPRTLAALNELAISMLEDNQAEPSRAASR